MTESLTNRQQLSHFDEIVELFEKKKLISRKVYEKFTTAIANHDHEEFIIQGEIIIRGILIKIIRRLHINIEEYCGINTILNVSWNYHIITNERIYAYLWVFARAAQQIRNDDLVIASHEALMHASIFFGFLIELNKKLTEYPQLEF